MMAPRRELLLFAQDTLRCSRATAMTAQVQLVTDRSVAHGRENDDAAHQENYDELKERHLGAGAPFEYTHDDDQDEIAGDRVKNSSHGSGHHEDGSDDGVVAG